MLTHARCIDQVIFFFQNGGGLREIPSSLNHCTILILNICHPVRATAADAVGISQKS